MSTEAVVEEYQKRLDQVRAGIQPLAVRRNLMMIAAGAIVVLALYWGLGYRDARGIPSWLGLLPLPFAIYAWRLSDQLEASRSALAGVCDFYARGISNLSGEWAGQGEDGEEYVVSGHVYARDLTLFGPGSLFERLCITRTEIGRRRLAEYLQDDAPSLEECMARQVAVQELRDKKELREAMAALRIDVLQSSSTTFASWLNRKPVSFSIWMRLAAGLCTLLTLTCIGLLASREISWKALLPYAQGILVCQCALGWFLQDRVKDVIENCRIVYCEITLIREGLALLAKQEFQSPKLAELTRRIREEHAVSELLTLERYFSILHQRTKEYFYGISLLLLIGSHCAMAIEAWRRRSGTALAGWLDSWAEFETLNALGCYAYESPENSYPAFEVSATVFQAEGLGHPLLPAAVCVRNHVHLSAEGTKVLIISGSNMAGKSTLLRAIGINAVLAKTGAPVCARRLRLSLFSTCASLSIQDAILEGKSRFMAEVERLKASIELSKQRPPVLFLIDEIFSGTNSRDRRIAAEAVVRTLLAAGSLGAISTHDLALTEIADIAEVGGTNVHMGSRDESDPLDFDFLLKPGVTKEANALAIARMAGVPV